MTPLWVLKLRHRKAMRVTRAIVAEWPREELIASIDRITADWDHNERVMFTRQLLDDHDDQRRRR